MIKGRVRTITARGFRRFQESTSHSFVAPDGKASETVVVAGPNGAGKSSLFEALLFALGRSDQLVSHLDASHRNSWLKGALSADAEVRVLIDVESAAGTLIGAMTPCKLEVVRGNESWTATVVGQEQPIAENEMEALLSAFPLLAFSSWRQPYLSGPLRPMADPPARAVGNAGRLYQLKQRIIDERARSAFTAVEGRDRVWLERLNAAWSAMRGNVASSLDVDVADSDEDAQLFDLFVTRSDPVLGPVTQFPLDQLSSGELEWISIVGTIVTTGFDGLLLIDEPELHLHPEWQARILPGLRGVAPESQIIIASHSDPPWDQVFSFQRVLLTRPAEVVG